MALRYLFSFDFMDGYHHVAINLQYTDWLQFDIDSEVYTNNCLNFSWNQSLHYFVHGLLHYSISFMIRWL